MDPAPLTLAQLGRGVAHGEISAVALVEESLRRVDESRAALNAVVSLRRDEALADAAALDAYVGSGGRVGALSGVPMLVKDNQDVAGMPTTHGSRALAGVAAAREDGLMTARLRAAGAIVVGKTNLPEFAIEGFTDNPLFGATVNPWTSDFSPGGSSGGSAAALSAGLAPLATGTDGGGSVRIPAGLCGLLGFKPTNGVIGRDVVPAWIDFTTDGFMATAADDLRLLLRLTAGPTRGDPTAAPNPVPADRLPTHLIAATRTSDLGDLPREVAQALSAAVEMLADLLRTPAVWKEPSSFFVEGDPDIDWFTLATAEHVAALGRDFIADNAGLLHPTTSAFLDQGIEVTIDDYLAARRRRFRHTRALDELLGDSTILATPVLAVGGFTPSGRLPGNDAVSLLPADVYSTAVQNVTGLPAVSLPAGRLPSGLPFGLQVTAPRFADHMLLRIAELWERAHPWPAVAPGYAPFGL